MGSHLETVQRGSLQLVAASLTHQHVPKMVIEHRAIVDSSATAAGRGPEPSASHDATADVELFVYPGGQHLCAGLLAPRVDPRRPGS